MEVTLKDLYLTNQINDFKLIAGKNGLKNPIEGCSILDYHFDKELNILNSELGFNRKHIVLTSFLYAKDNEFLIFDALKRLIERKVSGIAINNVYNLSINDMIIKTANAKNFPMFLFKNSNLRFEDVILNIDKSINKLKNIPYYEQLIYKALTKPHENPKENVYILYPKIKNNFLCVFFTFLSGENTTDVNNNLYSSLAEILPTSVDFMMYKYRLGALVIFSFDTINGSHSIKQINTVLESKMTKHSNICWGISNVYRNISDFNKAVSESIYASAYCNYCNLKYLKYEDLGTYRLIFSNFDTPEFRSYKQHIISQIQIYDYENNTKLLQTLTEFIHYNGNIHILSEKTYQHENTIRNKLDKIKQITNLDFKSSSDYEKLSLAIKIHISREILNSYIKESETF